MTTFSELAKQEGLFALTARLQRERRASLSAQQGVWLVPVSVKERKRTKFTPPPEESFGKVTPLAPLKLIVPMGCDSVEDIVPEVSEDDIVELAPSAPLEREEPEDVMFALAEEPVAVSDGE
jgi:hypothetical protein